MIYLGCHLSISKGFFPAAKEAGSIGANTFQFFTRNPRGGAAKAIDPKDIEKCTAYMQENAFGPLLAHAPYTMNLCSDKENVRDFAQMIFKEDVERMRVLPDVRLLFHPGSHVGQGAEQGISYIVDVLNQVLVDGYDGPWILLEGMSGKGSEIGGRTEELVNIIQGVKHNERLGVCIDTCHLHSAGYDVVNDFDGVLDEFEAAFGLWRIKGVHVNDNMNDFGCHKDRHAKIGEGSIGLDAICRIVGSERLAGLPFNLETPNELDGYGAEIKMIREVLG